MPEDWEDSQPDGPEDQSWEPHPWKPQPQPPQQDIQPNGRQPHGYYEPSKWSLIDASAVRDRKHWHKLLADNVAPHDVWWVRLMKFMKGR